ncbi:MAG: hypothetical protein DLM69_08565 [Candidatus Chloroheliales bacterium]|nr:MAG: hypothetical protein DLM69_08565 [Chloroflexota bacterium]
MKLQVRTGRRVNDDLRGIARYLRSEGVSREVSDHLVNELIDKMVYLGEHQIGRRVDDDLPADYRRYRVGKYILFYLINHPASKLTIYHVRHGARKPLTSRTHRQRGAQAERESFPLTPASSPEGELCLSC